MASLKLKQEVFNYYGWSCCCCGSKKRLTIDHVNGDGDKHRAALLELNDKSKSIYPWLVQNGFPAGFQTLCERCNSSKQAGNRCLLHDVCFPVVEVAAKPEVIVATPEFPPTPF